MYGDLIDVQMTEGSQEPSLEQLQSELEANLLELATARKEIEQVGNLRDAKHARLLSTDEWIEYERVQEIYASMKKTEEALYGRVREIGAKVYDLTLEKKLTPHVSAKETRKYELADAYRALCWALQKEYRAMVEDLNNDRVYDPHLIRLDEKAFMEFAKFYLEGLEKGAVTSNQIPFDPSVISSKDDVTIAVAKNLSGLIE